MIISFISSKGGVGKSTACAAIATELARQGGSVLVFDLDPNRSLYSWSNDFKPESIRVLAVNPVDLAEAYEANRRCGADHLLFDLGGFMDAGILDAVSVSDMVVIPTGPSRLDLKQAVAVASLSKKLRVSFKLLLTRVRGSKSEQREWTESEIASLGLPRFSGGMVDRDAYRDIFRKGKPHHLDLKAGREVLEIVSEIKREVRAVARKAAA